MNGMCLPPFPIFGTWTKISGLWSKYRWCIVSERVLKNKWKSCSCSWKMKILASSILIHFCLQWNFNGNLLCGNCLEVLRAAVALHDLLWRKVWRVNIYSLSCSVLQTQNIHWHQIVNESLIRYVIFWILQWLF